MRLTQTIDTIAHPSSRGLKLRQCYFFATELLLDVLQNLFKAHVVCLRVAIR